MLTETTLELIKDETLIADPYGDDEFNDDVDPFNERENSSSGSDYDDPDDYGNDDYEENYVESYEEEYEDDDYEDDDYEGSYKEDFHLDEGEEGFDNYEDYDDDEDEDYL